MPPNDSQILSKKPRFMPKLKRRQTFIGLTVVLVLALAAGFYWYRHYHNPNKINTGSYTYTYKTLVPYKLTGEKDGNGITLKQPTEFTKDTVSSARQTQAFFNHSITRDNGYAIIAQLALASVTTGAPPSSDYLKNLGQSLADPTAAAYAAALKPLNDFITQRLPEGYKLNSTQPRAVTTPNLKTNTWQLDFSATPKDPSNPAGLPNLSGVEIFTIGKTTFYYFMLDGVDYNWQANQAIIIQSINSLQIDQ